jgi:hypothetical protein
MNQPVNRHPEPEIIPPGAPLPSSGPSLWVSADTRHTHYVHVTRIGPVGFGLMTLAGGVIAALAILFVLGAAVIGVATIGALTLVGIIAGLLHRPKHPLR